MPNGPEVCDHRGGAAVIVFAPTASTRVGCGSPVELALHTLLPMVAVTVMAWSAIQAKVARDLTRYLERDSRVAAAPWPERSNLAPCSTTKNRLLFGAGPQLRTKPRDPLVGPLVCCLRPFPRQHRNVKAELCTSRLCNLWAA
jgi:hypothetical protein